MLSLLFLKSVLLHFPSKSFFFFPRLKSLKLSPLGTNSSSSFSCFVVILRSYKSFSEEHLVCNSYICCLIRHPAPIFWESEIEMIISSLEMQHLPMNCCMVVVAFLRKGSFFCIRTICWSLFLEEKKASSFFLIYLLIHSFIKFIPHLSFPDGVPRAADNHIKLRAC